MTDIPGKGNCKERTRSARKRMNNLCVSFASFLETPPSVAARLERALVPRAALADKSAI